MDYKIGGNMKGIAIKSAGSFYNPAIVFVLDVFVVNGVSMMQVQYAGGYIEIVKSCNYRMLNLEELIEVQKKANYWDEEQTKIQQEQGS